MLTNVDKIRTAIAGLNKAEFHSTALPKFKALYSTLAKMENNGEIKSWYAKAQAPGKPRRSYQEVNLKTVQTDAPARVASVASVDAWRSVWPDFFTAPRFNIIGSRVCDNMSARSYGD